MYDRHDRTTVEQSYGRSQGIEYDGAGKVARFMGATDAVHRWNING